jgi:hypothetical protein
MVIVMNLKRSTWFGSLLISTLLPGGACAATLGEVKSVYLFPMSNGLDQYLADRLTRDHIFQVVTDPKAADAVLTDSLGAGFENQLLKMRPELKPVPPAKPPAAGDKDKDKDKDSDKDADKKDENQSLTPLINSFRTAQGTVFLVSARTQQVVWSAYQKPSTHRSKDMERTAAKIAALLAKDVVPPAAGTPAKK